MEQVHTAAGILEVALEAALHGEPEQILSLLARRDWVHKDNSLKEGGALLETKIQLCALACNIIGTSPEFVSTTRTILGLPRLEELPVF